MEVLKSGILIKLSVRRAQQPLDVSLTPGEVLFVLGANGTGKSSLLHAFYTQHSGKARRISAHRQTWFESNAVTLSPQQKRATEDDITGLDRDPSARWRERHAEQRASIAIYNLIDAENIRARGITAAVDRANIDLATELAQKDAPIKVINQLLRQSGIPIQISIHENDQVVASKSQGPTYSIAELSDGERNALLIAAAVLTVKEGTLILVDEPERHLHRSIISPLLTLLTATRKDCYFVISTHEVMLPIDNPAAHTLLVRDCVYTDKRVTSWDADLLPTDAAVDEDLKKDILGSRRKVIFVEGIGDSLDKPLYSLLFPGISVVCKSSCRDVERAVSGIREANGIHWMQAYGIVDNDRRPETDIQKLKMRGVYALSVFAVESVYYHPEIQRRVASRLTVVTGQDPAARVSAAKTAGLHALEAHVQRLAERVAANEVRGEFLRQIPGRNEVSNGGMLSVELDVGKIVMAERIRLSSHIKESNLSAVIARYPVRETPLLTVMSKNLGFQGREQYEGAVRTLIMDDREALTFVLGLFGDLATDVGVA